MNKDVWMFAACAVAAFGMGWAIVMLMDVPPHKALASGVVTLCFYVIGNRQTPV